MAPSTVSKALSRARGRMCPDGWGLAVTTERGSRRNFRGSSARFHDSLPDTLERPQAEEICRFDDGRILQAQRADRPDP